MIFLTLELGNAFNTVRRKLNTNLFGRIHAQISEQIKEHIITNGFKLSVNLSHISAQQTRATKERKKVIIGET